MFITVLIIMGSGYLAADESPYFVKTVPISKIYNHQLGYRVVYMTNNFEFKVFYLPKEWFAVAGETGEVPKAEIVFGREAAYPYFSIFWKEGSFSHIRIYASDNLQDSSWGDATNLGDIDDKFNVESLSLDF